MSTSKYPNENSINFETGGREAIERLVTAYGFTTRQALADHLKVSKSTLANRYLRDTFPSDWIIKCALETGVSLLWLTTGNGPVFDDARKDVVTVKRKKIIDGKLYDSNFYFFDQSFLPDSIHTPLIICDAETLILCEQNFDEITDGKWLVEVEGKVSIRTLTRIPIGRVKVSDKDCFFECNITDIKVIAKCRFSLIETL
ncbi:helix-turn-helix domain-containing protein [Enterobacter roggenkampii]|uniref:phage repressor protein CI n=1 Tax=Enterobacter roggenkampii TaxID=1812935 RepID=UPI0020040FE6|nr:phage repressor protein CI [Enterobacter roggenkampii]MCK7150941.1 helix-turn-helix domain-containing protein [Enterobacter roggenkampii]